jgi:peptide/nickel transport system permease protein
VVIFGAISIPSKITLEAALSFLGVGITPPTPSWGRSISGAVAWINVDPLYLLYPGMALFLITFAFNILGDYLRDRYDPQTADSAKGGV